MRIGDDYCRDHIVFQRVLGETAKSGPGLEPDNALLPGLQQTDSFRENDLELCPSL